MKALCFISLINTLILHEGRTEFVVNIFILLWKCCAKIFLICRVPFILLWNHFFNLLWELVFVVKTSLFCCENLFLMWKNFDFVVRICFCCENVLILLWEIVVVVATQGFRTFRRTFVYVLSYYIIYFFKKIKLYLWDLVWIAILSLVCKIQPVGVYF